MPRAASRILLEITEIKIEPLFLITLQEIHEEGIETIPFRESIPNLSIYKNYLTGEFDRKLNAFDSFCTLWDSIHGVGEYSRNPLVWVIAFKRV
jgi:hypothetical protein